MNGTARWLVRVAAAVLAASLVGCAVVPRQPVPVEQVQQAKLPGMPDVRSWAGQPTATIERDLAESFAQESASEFPPGPDGTVRYAHLALSGGGANGAFGAGFLNGWTRAGTRPTFKIVTGVSTGALMAPFAFLGPDYDDALRTFYTTTRSRDIFELRSILWQLIAGEALADTRPLRLLIEQHVDEELLKRVARAHRQGRRLYIGTTNLDMPRFVVWNMGLIANSGRPEALELFRKVMLASASIPVAFPPVFFEVETQDGGPLYDEMHVDGGVGARVFLSAGVFQASIIQSRGGHGGAGREDIFVVHNGQLIPSPNPVRRSLPSIAVRVIDASGRAAAIGDLFRIYGYAQRENASFAWITIPNGVPMGGEETFDPVAMQQLYAIGFDMAARPDPWLTLPPGQTRATAPEP